MLTPYKHHLKNCHYKKGRTEAYPYVSRDMQRCDCPWYYDRYVGSKRKRTALGTANKQLAVQRLVETEAAGDIPKPAQTSIEDAVTAFTVQAERDLESSTLKQYELVLRQLKAFCADKGFISLKQLTLVKLERFVASWKVGPRTEGKRIERVKRFFNYCVEHKMLEKSEAKGLKPPPADKVKAVPFTEEQVKAIEKACAAYDGPDRARLVILTELMLSTGLRISDSVTISHDKIIKTSAGYSVHLDTQKTGTNVTIPIKDELAKSLLALNEYPFWTQHSDLEHATANWRKKFDRVFKAAGLKGHPHQFRHTFAKRMLLKGVSILSLSKLLSHGSFKITEDTYSRWIAERQTALDSEVRATW
jgi:site-specific recombinase XerD